MPTYEIKFTAYSGGLIEADDAEDAVAMFKEFMNEDFPEFELELVTPEEVK